jgi:hypothetical protein
MMQTVWIGGTELIQYKGRYFALSGKGAVMQLEWAHNTLDKPAVTFQNGRNSHEAALEVLDKAEDELIEHYRLVL